MSSCHWRSLIPHGHQYQQLSDFPADQCVLITPRVARLHNDLPDYLPYFNVHTSIRRRIYSTFYHVHPRPRQHIRHHCLFLSEFDSRGLCVNPRHLSLGTSYMNHQDALKESVARKQKGYLQPLKETQTVYTGPIEPFVEPIPLSAEDMKMLLQCDTEQKCEKFQDEQPLLCATQILEGLRDHDKEAVLQGLQLLKRWPSLSLQSCRWHKTNSSHETSTTLEDFVKDTPLLLNKI